MAKTRDVAALAIQFCNIISSGASLEAVERLDTLTDTDLFRQALEDQNKTNEFVNIVTNNLKKTGPTMYSFLIRLLGIEPKQKEPKNKMAVMQARQELYWILACMSAESENIRKNLTLASVPELIGKDIGQLQALYQTDEVINNAQSLMNNFQMYRNLTINAQFGNSAKHK